MNKDYLMNHVFFDKSVLIALLEGSTCTFAAQLPSINRICLPLLGALREFFIMSFRAVFINIIHSYIVN